VYLKNILNPLELSRRKQIQGGIQDARTSFYQHQARYIFSFLI